MFHAPIVTQHEFELVQELRKNKRRPTKLNKINVFSGKLSDEHFEMMSRLYENEQMKLKSTVAELTELINQTEQKSADTAEFLKIVQKYEHITELTPEIMHELIEKIVVHAPDKSSDHRTQQIDIQYRFNVAVTTVTADENTFSKKKKAA